MINTLALKDKTIRRVGLGCNSKLPPACPQKTKGRLRIPHQTAPLFFFKLTPIPGS